MFNADTWMESEGGVPILRMNSHRFYFVPPVKAQEQREKGLCLSRIGGIHRLLNARPCLLGSRGH